MKTAEELREALDRVGPEMTLAFAKLAGMAELAKTIDQPTKAQLQAIAASFKEATGALHRFVSVLEEALAAVEQELSQCPNS